MVVYQTFSGLYCYSVWYSSWSFIKRLVGYTAIVCDIDYGRLSNV